MWIITHDNVHEAGINPAVSVPRSRDFLECVTKARNERVLRRRIFRLMKSERELFRGIAYFADDASYREILKPLDEFGRNLYDCDVIEYQVKDLSRTPNGRTVWNRVPEEVGRRFDEYVAKKNPQAYRTLIDRYGIDNTAEATEAMLIMA
ncbi:MAG: hypothetical protein IKK34_03070 [Clostridia bacterium]|nr:hypothetical protein [Clostridia bacterium]